MIREDLITRFAEDCFRFEALHQEIDGLIADADSEVLAYEYEDLANQAAEIVLKLSANGNNLGLNFYRYYVERLEYIIDYFRALLDYEETPFAEDEPNELDDEKARAYRGLGEFFATPAEVRFEGNPADCAFPKPPTFVFKSWELKSPSTAKDEEPDAEEEDDSEDEQPAELDDENDTQAAESDEAADGTAAGAPSSEVLLPPDVEHKTEIASKCWNKLSSEERARVWDSFAMWHKMNVITRRSSGGGDSAQAVGKIDDAEWYFDHAKKCFNQGLPASLMRNELNLRKRINSAIDAIPGFRDSEKFKELIERYPTYKEDNQGESI